MTFDRCVLASVDLLPAVRSAAGWALRAGVEACLVAALVLLAQRALRGRSSARWRHGLWLLVLARLALPALPGTPASPFGWLPFPGPSAADPAEAGPDAKAAIVANPMESQPAAVRGLAAAGGTEPTGRQVAAAEVSRGPYDPPSGRLPSAAETTEAADAGDDRDAPPGLERPSLEGVAAAGATGSAPASAAAQSGEVRATTAGPSADEGAGGDGAGAPPTMPTATPPGPPPSPFGWGDVLALLWAIGAAAMAGRVVWATLRLRATVRRLPAFTDPAVLGALDAARAALGVHRRPPLLLAPDDCGPALVGLLRPRLLLPPSAVDGRLPPDALRHVLLHELAHLRRGDVAVNWLLAGLRAVHWFNPVLWAVFRRVVDDRELATDEAVLAALAAATPAPAGTDAGTQAPADDAFVGEEYVDVPSVGDPSVARFEARSARWADARRSYGRTLIRLAELMSTAADAAVAAGSPGAGRRPARLPASAVGIVGVLEPAAGRRRSSRLHPLHRRIAMIAAFDPTPRRRWFPLTAGATVLLAGVALTGAARGDPPAAEVPKGPSATPPSPAGTQPTVGQSTPVSPSSAAAADPLAGADVEFAKLQVQSARAALDAKRAAVGEVQAAAGSGPAISKAEAERTKAEVELRRAELELRYAEARQARSATAAAAGVGPVRPRPSSPPAGGSAVDGGPGAAADADELALDLEAAKLDLQSARTQLDLLRAIAADVHKRFEQGVSGNKTEGLQADVEVGKAETEVRRADLQIRRLELRMRRESALRQAHAVSREAQQITAARAAREAAAGPPAADPPAAAPSAIEQAMAARRAGQKSARAAGAPSTGPSSAAVEPVPGKSAVERTEVAYARMSQPFNGTLLLAQPFAQAVDRVARQAMVPVKVDADAMAAVGFPPTARIEEIRMKDLPCAQVLGIAISTAAGERVERKVGAVIADGVVYVSSVERLIDAYDARDDVSWLVGADGAKLLRQSRKAVAALGQPAGELGGDATLDGDLWQVLQRLGRAAGVAIRVGAPGDGGPRFPASDTSTLTALSVRVQLKGARTYADVLGQLLSTLSANGGPPGLNKQPVGPLAAMIVGGVVNVSPADVLREREPYFNAVWLVEPQSTTRAAGGGTAGHPPAVAPAESPRDVGATRQGPPGMSAEARRQSEAHKLYAEASSIEQDDPALALARFKSIKRLPKETWPADLDARIQAVDQELRRRLSE